MKIYLEGHSFVNEVQTVSQIFYPNQPCTVLSGIDTDGVVLVSKMDGMCCIASYYENGRLAFCHQEPIFFSNKDAAKISMYRLLEKVTGYSSPWGFLTGIRPSKIVHGLWDKGHTDTSVLGILTSYYLVTEEKAALSMEVAKAEKKIISGTGHTFSLYIGIPFCPTRCLYCSFTSYPIHEYAHKVEKYLEVVQKELEYCKNPQTVYIGGGTPTALSAKQLEKLLQATPTPQIELTVEAGRPDTITREKLAVMKRYGVTRISINPQTLHDKTLALVGRNHSVAQFFESFALAREMGFNNINVDLILGLPGETAEDVQNTLQKLSPLSPENITVHIMSVKRGSRLKEQLGEYPLTSGHEVESMLAKVKSFMAQNNMKPYSMYRQKNMLGNFENVGYTKEGYTCLFNVQTMCEKQTILAVGAGGVTKKVDLATDRIERVFNVKNVDIYLERSSKGSDLT